MPKQNALAKNEYAFAAKTCFEFSPYQIEHAITTFSQRFNIPVSTAIQSPMYHQEPVSINGLYPSETVRDGLPQLIGAILEMAAFYCDATGKMHLDMHSENDLFNLKLHVQPAKASPLSPLRHLDSNRSSSLTSVLAMARRYHAQLWMEGKNTQAGPTFIARIPH